MNKKLIRIVIVLLFILFLPRAETFACELVGTLPDINSDGAVTVAVFGDSLVSGFGDTRNGNKGGYVLRAAKRFSGATFLNLGVAGQRTFELLKSVEDAFTTDEPTDLDTGLLNADLIVVDIGRNDRWLFGTPLATYRNLKRIRTTIEAKVFAKTGIKPVVVTTVLMLPNRGSQGPWVKELNAILLKRNRADAPADLRFDLVSKRLLSADQVHPTPKGYDALAKVLVSYVRKSYPVHAAAYGQGSCSASSS